VQVFEHGVAATFDHEVRRFDDGLLFRAAQLVNDHVEHIPAFLSLVREVGDEAEVLAFVRLVRLPV
jgi:hypothetical protein